MYNFLIHDGTEILNMVISSSKEDAEQATGLNAENQEDVFVDIPVFDENGDIQKDENNSDVTIKIYGQIGWIFYQDKWIPPAPSDNLTWNGYSWIGEE